MWTNLFQNLPDSANEATHCCHPCTKYYYVGTPVSDDGTQAEEEEEEEKKEEEEEEEEEEV